MAIIKGTKDGKPQYRVRWNYRRDQTTGKRAYEEKRFQSLQDAEKFHERVTIGTTANSEKFLVRDMMTAWRSAKSSSWSLRYQRDCEQQQRLRIDPFLGARRVAALTPALLADWHDWMTAEGHAPRTRNKSIDAVKAANRWARGRGLSTNTLIDDVPRADAPPPKPANPHPPSVVARIVDGCHHLRDATLLCVAAYTGLRWSELRGLQWGDVDLNAEQITLRRSIDIDRTVKAPKSGKPRITPILKPGVEALTTWREACADTSDAAWVFPSITGRPLSSGWHVDILPKIRKASGVQFDPHELRDTFASILIAADIPEKELTMWLGHKSSQTTMSRYAQLFAARRTTVASKANAILSSLG